MNQAGGAIDIPSDAAFPALAELLDPFALRAALADGMAHDATAPRVDSVALTYVRYKPSVSLLLGVEATLAGGERRTFTLKAYPDPLAAQQLRDKWSSRRPLEPLAGPAVFTIPRLNAVVVSFPNDAALPGLKVAANPDRLRLVLTERVLQGGERARGKKLLLQPVKYKPERRFVARLRVGFRVAATQERIKRWMYVRAYAGSDGEPGRIATEQLCRTLPFVPRHLGCDTDLGLYFQEELPGMPLAALLPDPPEAAIAAAGERLARIHAAEVALPRQLTLPQLFAELDDTVAHLAALDRDAGRLAHAVVYALRRADILPVAAVASHGDFYYHQLLVADDGVRVVDFDEACHCDAALDVGNFLAHLDWLTDTQRLPVDRAAALRAAFLHGYGARPANLALLETVALVRLAARPFRNLVPDWRALTLHTLERAQAILHRPGLR